MKNKSSMFITIKRRALNVTQYLIMESIQIITYYTLLFDDQTLDQKVHQSRLQYNLNEA